MILIIFSLTCVEKNTNVIGKKCRNVRVFYVLFCHMTGKQQLEHRALCMSKLVTEPWRVQSKKLVSKLGAKAEKSNCFACLGVQKARGPGVLNVRVLNRSE